MNLQEEIRQLPEVPEKDAWSGYRNRIREEMIAHDDWSKFKTWPTIGKTLYCGRIPNTDAEYNLMLGSPWVEGLDIEDGTSIHQAYGLWLYQEHTGHEFSEKDTFLEFGGGYGEMARMVLDRIHPKRYTIFDFPEINILQRFYVGEADGFSALSGKIPVSNCMPTILISICALSEAPVVSRNIFLGWAAPESLLIRFQPSWDGVDNTKYFVDFAKENYKDFSWSPAPAYTNHFYLVAWNRK